MEQVTFLATSETVRLDQEKLNSLYQQLGDVAAEDVVCRAIEELAVRLSYTERMYRQNEALNMRKSVRSMVAIADQIGMHTLSRVAHDVTQCIDDNDPIALSATLARLLRIGERSLTAVWDLQDLSI